MSITVGIDCYCDLEFATGYIARKAYTAEWDSATDTTKEKALKEATLKIDRLRLKGLKAAEGQALEFPRSYFGNVEVDVPVNIKYAVCEEALAILRYQDNARYNAQVMNVVSVSIENGLKEVYSYRDLSLLSFEAKALVKEFAAGSAVIR